MPKPALPFAVSLISAVALAVTAASPPMAANADGDRFFETKIRPLLFEHCYSCHGADKQTAGLRLDLKEAAMKGRDTGAVIVPGKPEESRIVQAVRYDGAVRMPPAGKLGRAEIAAIEEWVRMGAPWPEKKEASKPETPRRAGRDFWSFRPIANPKPPVVRNAAWPRTDIDRFVLESLEKAGLRPAAPADRRTLLRRATFDLTGLPPTPQEVRDFLADRSPSAWERVVDRLLASPHYGERWGRHWLDVVRYTDSLDARGVGSEGDVAFAWRYRDWVVDALNRDLPYDQFLAYQLAGDLIPGPGEDGYNREGVIATGVLAIGNWGNGDADKDKILTDIADDQLDLVSRAVMGLTLSCARCHDHKFDPFTQKDYYSLAGIFFSTHILPKLTPKGAGENLMRIPLASPKEIERREDHSKKLAALEEDLKQTREKAYGALAKRLAEKTSDYLSAVYDFLQASAAGGETPDPDEFARSRGLEPFALRQWMSHLGMGDFPLMTTPLRDLLNNGGVHGWRGQADTPSAVVNTTSEARSILTFTLPPKSVSMHPGPASGVAASWRSPVAATVSVSGKLKDADGACGDGSAWLLDLRTSRGFQQLASGEFPNAGEERFGPEKTAALGAVTVRQGDRIQLLLLPKANHGCDTTVIELKIADHATGRTWDISDVVADPLAGNPHADRFGNNGVWSFRDMAGSRRTNASATGANSPAERLGAAADKGDREAFDAAAAEIARAHTPDSKSPFWVNDPADEAALPEVDRSNIARIARALDQHRAATPPPLEYTNGARDGGVPESPHAGVHDVRVHIRGSYARLGENAPRGFPAILTRGPAPVIGSQSGRAELAKWLVSPDHPLTARVMANRIWLHHFGEGIVRTPGNFGFLGERPTNPALLDHLARRFMALGWSMKKMHREIMLSAAYMQSSRPDPETLRKDPDNRLFGRMNRRRLESEAVRDSLLAVSGRLDTAMGGVAYRDFSLPRRTLYYMTIRSDRTGFGPLFDVADPTTIIDKRTVSTVAPQSLFLMNHPFVLAQAKSLAERLERDAPPGGEARIRAAYELLYGRLPAPKEIAIGLAATGGGTASQRTWESYAQVLLCANEFLFVD